MVSNTEVSVDDNSHREQVEKELYGNKQVFLMSIDGLISLGLEDYWILIVDQQVVSIHKNKKDVVFPREGNFYVAKVSYKQYLIKM